MLCQKKLKLIFFQMMMKIQKLSRKVLLKKEGKIDPQFDENEFIRKKNLFYYVINIVPQTNNIFYNKQNIRTSFINSIERCLHIEDNNIFVSFNNKIAFINTFIKTKTFMDFTLNQMEKKYPDFVKLYEYKSIYDNILNLLQNEHYFDTKGNTICFNSNYNLERGTEKYYPPYKWFGIGLNVIDKYDNNEWLDINSEKWAIAYYSLSQALSSNQIKEELNKILIKDELIEDKFNSSSKDKRHLNKEIEKGVYLYQDIKMVKDLLEKS